MGQGGGPGLHGQHGVHGSQGFLGVAALHPSILQLVPFLPSNIPHALETLSTGGLFSDGGHSFLQNL